MITSIALPGATFYSVKALRQFVHERLAYESAVRAFHGEGDEIAFAETLTCLGYTGAEIEQHHRRGPKFRIQTDYHA
jgi:hypothetical protein